MRTSENSVWAKFAEGNTVNNPSHQCFGRIHRRFIAYCFSSQVS
jgi:hypothetical protein